MHRFIVVAMGILCVGSSINQFWILETQEN